MDEEEWTPEPAPAPDEWANPGGGRTYPEQRPDGSTWMVTQSPEGNYTESPWQQTDAPSAPSAAPGGFDQWARPEGGRGYPEQRPDGSTWWVNQDVAGNYTQKPWQQPAPVSQFAQWAQEFTMVHGREPQAKDYQDKVWMDEFVAKQGRFPTREEWVRNWYAKKPAQRNYEPEFVPFKSIGGPGGWQKEWGAPQAWNSGEDWNSAFERVGFGAQQAAPENRANSLATQRLIGSSMNYADYQTKADAILSFLKQFEKPVETKAAEETAAAKGGPAGGAPGSKVPAGIPFDPALSRQMRGEQMQAAGNAYQAAPGATGQLPPGPLPTTTYNPQPYNPAEPQFNPYANIPTAQPGLRLPQISAPQWQMPDWMQAMNPVPGLQRSGQNILNTFTNPTATQPTPPWSINPQEWGDELLRLYRQPLTPQPFNAIPSTWR